MLEPIADDVWIEARPLRFFGVETGTRMTVVRLDGGRLLVHSPVRLDDETKAAVDALGRVEAIVAPSLFHHLFVAGWSDAYPAASLWACPGLDEKRPDVKWTGILGDAPEEPWNGELEQVFFGARSLENEVIFFHRRTRSILSVDFVFNLATHRSLLTRLVAGALGQREPGPTLLERILIRDRAAAREQIGRVIAWGAERLLLAHGDIVRSDATEVVRRAYRWL